MIHLTLNNEEDMVRLYIFMKNKIVAVFQVEQTGAVAPTPEERHVANMQINGYENPTYKYFEVKE